MRPITITLVNVTGEPTPERPACVTFRVSGLGRRRPYVAVRVWADPDRDGEVVSRFRNCKIAIGDRKVSLRAIALFLTEYGWPWKVGQTTELTPEWLAQAEYRLGGPLGPIQ